MLEGERFGKGLVGLVAQAQSAIKNGVDGSKHDGEGRHGDEQLDECECFSGAVLLPEGHKRPTRVAAMSMSDHWAVSTRVLRLTS
jgi:hypothetical protein